jgi:hypothetical protein
MPGRLVFDRVATFAVGLGLKHLSPATTAKLVRSKESISAHTAL